MPPKTTTDGLLDNQIQVEQPAEGYRIAVDTILLAAAVPAKSGDRVLDLGCGVGGAMLALAFRVPDIHGVGIEIQPELVRLCLKNIERNALKAELSVLQADAMHLPADLVGVFDHVMMNPPYHDERRHDASNRLEKQLANTERAGDLALWISAAAKALKAKGEITIIHRADRVDDVTRILEKSFGAIGIKPILTKPDKPPKRVTIHARKGAALAPPAALPPLVLHNPDGTYTPEAEAILRGR